MNQGGQKTGLQRGDQRASHQARVIGGKLVMPAELQQSMEIILDAAEVEIISDEMLPWWKAYGPSWRTSCRISTAIETALKLTRPASATGLTRTAADYTVY